jgi:hypothetical protein
MYSILLKLTNTTADRWKYLTDSEGEVYVANTIEEVEAKIAELLQTTPLNQIKAVRNCTITNEVTVEEVISD